MMTSLRHHVLPATAMILLASAGRVAAAEEAVATPPPVAIAPAAKTAAPVVPSDEEWQALRTKIETELAERIKQEAAAAVPEEAVARELKFGWPVKMPVKTVDDILQSADADAKAAAQAKYPDSAKAVFLKEAEAKYPLHKIGDEVRISLRQGAGTTEVKGRLFAVSSERIRIGDRRLAPRDIDDDTLACLDADVHAQAVDREVRRKWQLHMVERETYRMEDGRRLEKERMTAAGYRLVKKPRGRGTEWVPARLLLNHEMEQRLRKAAEELRAKLEPAVFKAADFVWNQNEWIPTVVLEDRQAKAAVQATTQQPPAAAAPQMPAGPPPPWAQQGQKLPPGMPPGMMLPPGMKLPPGVTLPPGMKLPPGMMPPGATPAAAPATGTTASPPPPWEKPAAPAAPATPAAQPAPAKATPAKAAASTTTPTTAAKPAGKATTDKTSADFFN